MCVGILVGGGGRVQADQAARGFTRKGAQKDEYFAFSL